MVSSRTFLSGLHGDIHDFVLVVDEQDDRLTFREIRHLVHRQRADFVRLLAAVARADRDLIFCR